MQNVMLLTVVGHLCRGETVVDAFWWCPKLAIHTKRRGAGLKVVLKQCGELYTQYKVMDGGKLPADECKNTEFMPVPSSSSTKICICHTFNTKLNNLCWEKLGISGYSQVLNLFNSRENEQYIKKYFIWRCYTGMWGTQGSYFSRLSLDSRLRKSHMLPAEDFGLVLGKPLFFLYE